MILFNSNSGRIELFQVSPKSCCLLTCSKIWDNNSLFLLEVLDNNLFTLTLKNSSKLEECIAKNLIL